VHEADVPIVKHKIDIDNTTLLDRAHDFLVGLVASFGATDVRFAFNNYNIKHRLL